MAEAARLLAAADGAAVEEGSVEAAARVVVAGLEDLEAGVLVAVERAEAGEDEEWD